MSEYRSVPEPGDGLVNGDHEVIQFPPEVWQEGVSDEDRQAVQARLIGLSTKIAELEEQIGIFKDVLRNERIDQQTEEERDALVAEEDREQKMSRSRRLARSLAERFVATAEERTEIEARREHRAMSKGTLLSEADWTKIRETHDELEAEVAALLIEEAELEKKYLTVEARQDKGQLDSGIVGEDRASQSNESLDKIIIRNDLSARQIHLLDEVVARNRLDVALDRTTLIFLYSSKRQHQNLYTEELDFLDRRNLRADISTIFSLEEAEVALNPEEINEKTKFYNGQITPDVIQRIIRFNIENVWANFPETRKTDRLTVGGLDWNELQSKLNEVCKQSNGTSGVDSSALDKLEEIYNSVEFARLHQSPEVVTTIRLRVGELGFSEWTPTNEVFQRIQELGLPLCPDIVAPYQRLKDVDQSQGESAWYNMYIESSDPALDSLPNFFLFANHGDGLSFNYYPSRPGSRFNPNTELMFRLSAPNQQG